MLIVGIGNPGRDYEKTRHNLGFMVLDRLANQLGLEWQHDKYSNSQVTKSGDIYLVKPESYVNLTGESIKRFIQNHRAANREIIVIHDDADLDFGRLKMKNGGSSAGHKGIESLDESIGSDYYRLRIGIGRDKRSKPLADYVLDNFTAAEQKKLPAILDQITAYLVKSVEQNNIVLEDFNAQEKN